MAKKTSDSPVRDDEAMFALEVFRASMPAYTTQSSVGIGFEHRGEPRIIRETPSEIHKLATEILMRRLKRS